MSDFSRFTGWVRGQLATFREHQDELDQAITSLTVAIHDRPVNREPGSVRAVEDPNSLKYRQFGFQLDRILDGLEPAGEIYWRTLWLRKCKHAIMAGDCLDDLVAISEIRGDLCKQDSEDTQMDSG